MNKLVCINAGHGGKDPGATNGKHKEKDITLIVSKKIKTVLTRHNVKVLMTRDNDSFVSLSDSALMANQSNAGIFVSIHCNSFHKPDAQGVEAYAYLNSKDGKALSKSILDNMVADKMYTKNRGVKTANFAVLRKTQMTASLVELGFMSNPDDLSILLNEQDKLADSVAKGILKYLGVPYKEETLKMDNKYKKAVDTLVGAKIIGSPDVWYHITDNNVKSLIYKMADYVK